MASGVLGSILPTFWYCCSLTKKVLRGDLPFFPTGFLFLPCFLLFCRGGEVKIEVNEKLLLDLIFQFW